VTDELGSRLAGAAHEPWRAQRWPGLSTDDMARVSSHSERSWSAVRSRMGPSSAVRGLFGDADILYTTHFTLRALTANKSRLINKPGKPGSFYSRGACFCLLSVFCADALIVLTFISELI